MAKAALSAFVSGFRDGHFPSAGAMLQTKIAQPLALPKVDYSRLNAVQACAALGYGPACGPAFSPPFEGASSGDGCGFMTDAPPVVLPRSRLRYRMPNCVRLRADGGNEVAGVKPDLAILPADGESDRERAWRLLDAVAGDLRARSAKP